MKIILSRKGFDSTNGHCPSPIFPDGTLLSLPIPQQENDGVSYSDLFYNGKSYSEIIKEIHPSFDGQFCHLDPDIRPNIRKNPVANWKPAFGQISSSNTYLMKNAEIGDIILFFGWFKAVIEFNGRYRFASSKDKNDFYKYADLQIIYGYMQIGEIITSRDRIKQYTWHPHASNSRIENKTNALYIPAEKLSFDASMPGYGTLCYRKNRVLTKKGYSRADWIPYEFLMPENVRGNRKNSSKTGNLYYAGIWQELVFNDSDAILNWAKAIIK